MRVVCGLTTQTYPGGWQAYINDRAEGKVSERSEEKDEGDELDRVSQPTSSWTEVARSDKIQAEETKKYDYDGIKITVDNEKVGTNLNGDDKFSIWIK